MIDRRSWLIAAASLAAASFPRITLAQASPVVRFGTSPAEGYAQPIFAQEAGIFTKDGIDAQVSVLANGATVTTAVAAGALDVGVSTIVNIANAILRGIPFVMIAPSSLTTPKSPAGLLCVDKASSIRVATDLEGKTVAVPALKQVVDLALDAWLAKGGADPNNVQAVESSFADMGPGLERGTFAAAIISEPALTNALEHDNVRSLADPYSAIAPSYTIAGWIVTKDYLQKNPDLVRKIAAALMEASRWANTHHDESAAIVSRVTKVDVDTIRHEVRPIFGDSMRDADLQVQLDAALKFGYLSRPVTAAALLGS